jgi:hypothetical protein
MAEKHDGHDQPLGASEEYDLMLQLERLESLREELEELGVKTITELEQRIAELHRQMDEMEGA